MIEAGIYSVILKWGLETLSGVVRDKDPQHIQIILEAIKLRNNIVQKRFEYAWAAAQDVLDLVLELEQELASVIAATPAHENRTERTKAFLAKLNEDFHPAYLRKLKKLRGKFEATNDLFSAYSLEFFAMLSFENVKKLIKANEAEKLADVARLYRQLWDTYSTVMLTLIRVSSSDIRFWVTDVTYSGVAETYARHDRREIEKVFTSGTKGNWALSLEHHVRVTEFWESVGSDTPKTET